jgi:hypothetical protein
MPSPWKVLVFLFVGLGFFIAAALTLDSETGAGKVFLVFAILAMLAPALIGFPTLGHWWRLANRRAARRLGMGDDGSDNFDEDLPGNWRAPGVRLALVVFMIGTVAAFGALMGRDIVSFYRSLGLDLDFLPETYGPPVAVDLAARDVRLEKRRVRGSTELLVRGVIVNTGPRLSLIPTLIIKAYGKDGKYLGFRNVTPEPAELPGGAERRFEMRFQDNATRITRVKVAFSH